MLIRPIISRLVLLLDSEFSHLSLKLCCHVYIIDRLLIIKCDTGLYNIVKIVLAKSH